MGEEMMSRYAADQNASLGYRVGSGLQTIANYMLLSQIRPMLDYFDALTAWLIGVCTSIGAMLQSQFSAQCNPPEYYLSDVGNCSCGDDVLKIPDWQARSRWTDSAFWCSGTLGMVDGANKPFVVYNPFTYAELQAKAAGMGDYLDCSSRSYTCSAPTDPEFEFQGVTLLNVLVKCRENFAQRRWDPMAFVLFDRSNSYAYKARNPPVIPDNYPSYIRDCLLASARAGSTNGPCLLEFLSTKEGNMALQDFYWAYEVGDSDLAHRTDACLSFSGPGKVDPRFASCADDAEEGGSCELSSHMWSPGSRNNVPVGQPHAVLHKGARADGLINRLHAEARRVVDDAVRLVRSRWSAPPDDVNVEFFSAEGDVIHQTLDCIFMGPYSKVDYWPIPTCQDGDECPVGPQWFRGATKKTRSVDPYECAKGDSPPYTCGSYARRSLIRYFIRRIVQEQSPNANSTAFQRAVMAQVNTINDTWAGANLACFCPNGTLQSIACCALSQGEFLPPNLDIQYTNLHSEHVLTSLNDNYDLLFARAMQNEDAWLLYMDEIEAARYVSTWINSQRVVDEGRFDPMEPVFSYKANESNYPFGGVDASLWDICHGSLKQIFWTMPVYPNGSLIFDNLPYDGDPAKLERYIRDMAREAFQHSPLYRHYFVRHAPSDSLICVPAQDLSSDGTLSFADYVHDAGTGARPSTVAGAPILTTVLRDYRAFALGNPCLCGWPFANGTCAAPAAMCVAMNQATGRADCRFDPADELLILSALDLACAEFEFGSAYGYMDSSSTDRWMSGETTLATATEDLLRHGRGGVRAIGLDKLSKNPPVAPESRKVPKAFGQTPTCVRRADFAEKMAEKLFPMAQGLGESGAGAYCMRYVVEVARLTSIELVLTQTSPQYAAQADVVNLWRRKCSAQLQLVHLCVSMNIFVPPLQKVSARRCQHFVPLQGATYYTTKDCLVNVDNVFYDPCRCVDCAGDMNKIVTISSLQANPLCRLRFDSRTMIKPFPIGTWEGEEEPDYMQLLDDSFDPATDADALGNSVNKWWSDEGFMNETGDSCDMIADYWPDEWQFPVGYHVSMPCLAEDRAYRSFHTAFVLDEASGDLIYQHDLLRDINTADTHYGVGGLCRGSNFAVDLHLINNARYCTRQVLDQRDDYTVFGLQDAPETYGDWVCTDSPFDLPWANLGRTGGALDTARVSVGTVPNMPKQGQPKYPNNVDVNSFEPGPWAELIGQDPWYECFDYPLYTCVTSVECPSTHTCRGRFCKGTMTHCESTCADGVPCEGVCLPREVQCVRHNECPNGQVCTGLGQCVTQTISVLNRVSDDVAFSSFARSCPAVNYSMLGASHWGYVSADVLRVHGMCSYGDSYKYQKMIERCSLADNGDYWDLNPFTCPYIDLESRSANASRWWEPGSPRPNIMFMRPTACDVDYERLSGFVGCSPGADSAYVNDNTGQQDVTFDTFYRTHKGQGSGARMPVSKMASRTDPKYGFLGLDVRIRNDAELQGLFTSCSSLDQCYRSPFTQNFLPDTRRVKGANNNLTTYTENDVFRCGAVGYMNGDRCRLDERVVPIYYFMCVRELSRQSACASSNLYKVDRDSLCSGILTDYNMGYTSLSQNIDGIRALMFNFKLPTTYDAYLDLVDCAQEMWAYLRDPSNQIYPNLYYPFDFVLYEMPFDWYYQCVMLNDFAVSPGSRQAQDCTQYTLRNNYRADNYLPRSSQNSDSGMTYLRAVRGGYTRAQLVSETSSEKALVNAALSDARAQLVRELYGGTADLSIPTCAMNRLWNVDSFTIFHSLILNMSYNDQQCKVAAVADAVDYFNKNNPASKLDVNTWEDQLSSYDRSAVFAQDGLSGSTLLQDISAYILNEVNYDLASTVGRGGSGMFVNNTAPGELPPDSITAVDPAPDPTDLELSTVDDSEASSFVCVFKDLQNDLRVRGLGACTRRPSRVNRQDMWQTCGGQVCSYIPAKRYSKDAKIGCQYSQPRGEWSVVCNQQSESGCGADFQRALYARFLQKYRLISARSNRFITPLSLPWYSETGFSFQLRAPLDYLGNIMPNKDKAVMCTINTDRPVNLMNCSNSLYQQLKEHVLRQMTYTGPPVVPGDAQLEWAVGRSFLANGVIFAISSMNRSDVFLRDMFDDEVVCKGSFDSRMCWRNQTSTSYSSMNPWHLGYWNPYSYCDISYLSQNERGQEFVNALCSSCDATYTPNMPFSTQCIASYQTLSPVPAVPRTTELGPYDYNLCHHVLKETPGGCQHDQSLLGSFTGLPVGTSPDSQQMNYGTKYESSRYTIANNLYEPSSWEIPDDFYQGIFAGKNGLWAGEDVPYGHLFMPETHIGGHRIGLIVQNASGGSVLRVFKLPLTTSDGDMDLDAEASTSKPVSEWVPNILSDMARESQGYRATVEGPMSASCPFKRYAFYSSNRSFFKPVTPSPRRAQHIFRNITGMLYSHPTVLQDTDTDVFGKYTTHNGFCFCPVVKGKRQSMCENPIGANPGSCSLQRTIRGLMGLEEHTSYVYTPVSQQDQPTRCTMQLDWPFLPSKLRDGSTAPGDFSKASDPANQECHVLDRLPKFQFKYISVSDFPSLPNSFHSTACQTGRVSSLAPGQTFPGRCLRMDRSKTATVHACTDSSAWVTLPRRVPLSASETAQKYRSGRRARCGACSALPNFRTQESRRALKSKESSFGEGYRLSAERMLMMDLREAVCAGSDDCDKLINKTNWAPGRFMRSYTRAPWTLFLNKTWSKNKQSVNRDDSERWTQTNWVYCPDRSSLATSEGCAGTITKEAWLARRTQVCPALVRELSLNGSQDPLSQVPFCMVDNTTSNLCRAVAEAKRLVQKANCIAAGNFTCLPRPWTYHPTSYDPSNQDWVYKTVLDYYRDNNGTCPQSESELTLIQFNAQFQQSCPANAMNFFVSVLNILRILATTVCLIISTLLSMVIELLTLLFTGAGGGAAKAAIVRNYAWIKRETKAMTTVVSDLLMDMVFSSGQIGSGLLNFLTSICNSVNKAFEWFLNIWCKYLMQHLTRFLNAMRTGMSMISAGFEILQDFMDEILAGVLPASFVAKYGTGAFQTNLIEKYAQPMEKRKATKARVGSGFDIKTKSISKSVGLGGKIAGGLGRAGAVFGAAIGVYELITGAMALADEARRALLYPMNFTLFDFDGVFDSIDTFMEFLKNEQTCPQLEIRNRFNQSTTIVSCFKSVLLRPEEVQESAAKSITATLCWANAVESAGQNTLFSCHSGSTCCKDAFCVERVVCDQCPGSNFEGVAKFACNTLTRLCQCSVPLLSYTECTRNDQCAGAQCMLIGSNGDSYGTTPCDTCPSSFSSCLIQPSGLPGRCSCFTDGAAREAICTDTTGMSTPIDSTKMCGYSTLADSGLQVWQFYHREIALVPCSQATQVICSVVWTTDTTNIRMGVAVNPIRVRTGRRLLSLDDNDLSHDYFPDYKELTKDEMDSLMRSPGWGAGVCGELAAAYKQNKKLGILEASELKSCSYWRFVGRQVLLAANITGDDTFLVSVDHFAKSLSSRDFLVQILQKPWSLVYAMLFHKLLRPLRAVMTVVSNEIERSKLASEWLLNMTKSAEDLYDAGLNGSTGRRLLTLERQTRLAMRRLEVSPPARKLQQVVEDSKLVREFSALIQLGRQDPPLDQRIASQWGAGPFAWPPRYQYYGANSCPAGNAVFEATRDTLVTLVRYYANWDRPPPFIDRSFRATLPKINLTVASAKLKTPADTWYRVAFGTVLSLLGTSTDGIRAFFTSSQPWSLHWIVVTSLTCDFPSALSCSRHTRDLFMSVVVFILLYLLVLVVCSAVGFPVLPTIFFFSFPLFILWYTYGFSPNCLPMLPTCLLSDVIHLAETVLPAEIILPSTSYCTGNQSGNCLTPCDAFNFTTWADPLAFAVCDVDPGTCRFWAAYNLPNGSVFAQVARPLQDKLREKLNTPNATLISSKICTLVTWIDTIPALAILLCLGVFIAFSVQTVVMLVPQAVGVSAQVMAFHRTP